MVFHRISLHMEIIVQFREAERDVVMDLDLTTTRQHASGSLVVCRVKIMGRSI